MSDFTQELKIAKFLVKYTHKFNFELDLKEWPIINFINFMRVVCKKSNFSEEYTKIIKIGHRYIGELTKYHEILYKKFFNRFFQNWMQEINKEIPSIATRIFKLRGIAITRSLEKNLGYVMSNLNGDFINFWHGEEGEENKLFLEMVYNGLLEDLIEAEAKLNKISENT